MQELDDHIAWLARHTTLVATTPDREASELASYERPARLTILFGSEGNGLPRALMDQAHERVRIAVAPDVDSLNVAATAAIVLWQLRRDRTL